MPDYRLASRADDDLWDIWRFIAQDNPEAASRVIVAAYKTFELLAFSPNLGKLRELSVATTYPIRSCPVSGFPKYIIFYQPTDEGIRILRIYHAKRDLEMLFT